VVIDTSAIAAPLFKEPDAARYAQAIAVSARRFISAVTHLELVIVCESRNGEMGATLVDEFLAFASIEVTAVSPRMALHAIDAYRRFGKGRHKARLNIGDCFSYALAAATDLPLLLKGNDFAQTDIRPAV